MSKLLIIADTQQEAKLAFIRHGSSYDSWALINSAEKAHGYIDMPYILIGNYWRIKDIGEIEEYATTHNWEAIA